MSLTKAVAIMRITSAFHSFIIASITAKTTSIAKKALKKEKQIGSRLAVRPHPSIADNMK
jgi:hypothetical protein